MEAPDAFIGGEVNEKPGDDNPALDETTGFAQGKNDTADLLRAREEAEEEVAQASQRKVRRPDNQPRCNRPTYLL
jgi:hypothetical protein